MTEKSHLMTESRWDFPGWGSAERILDPGTPIEIRRLDTSSPNKLGQWKATAICGNDITSSCLYVVALSALYAGPYAPIALILVAGVLYLYRKIYAEVVTALPLNGGAYNVLLNTTTKAKASVAACLTLLSYIATAVLSAHTAMHYAANLWPTLDVFVATLVVLAGFALLTVLGINESATVALGIFVVHLTTLAVLVLSATSTVAGDWASAVTHWQASMPEAGWSALWLGFAVAMLGISGFESSANFVEEQKEGVFPKTLRNMWLAVAFFNPVLSLLALSLVPFADLPRYKEDLLAEMGRLSVGTGFQLLISIDAVLVLSGAVLTAYVGVTGLVRRMTLDRVLPQVLLDENRWFHTNHWIIGGFFLLCSSILMATGGQIELLAGVYTLSFLSVMALFAMGNMLMKIKRSELPRQVRASWGAVMVALGGVLVALVGNLELNPHYVRVFAVYFLAAVAVVTVMFVRVQILRIALAVSKAMATSILQWNQRWTAAIIQWIHRINQQTVVFFTKHSDISELNRAALYVLHNELTNRLKVVHCFEKDADVPRELADNLKIIDRIYPELRIDLVLVQGRFGPELIERLSRQLNVPKNYMFIGTPGDRFPHRIAELGGVRLIM